MRISIMSVGALLMVVGCDNFLGLGDDIDFDVMAEFRQEDQIMLLTIRNTDSKPVYYHRLRLEHREAGLWSPLDDPTYSTDVALFKSAPIPGGEEHTIELAWGFSELEPGEYRVEVGVSSNGDAEVKTSNSVRIE